MRLLILALTLTACAEAPLEAGPCSDAVLTLGLRWQHCDEIDAATGEVVAGAYVVVEGREVVAEYRHPAGDPGPAAYAMVCGELGICPEPCEDIPEDMLAAACLL